MATHNKTLQLLAVKLGLGEEEKVLRKAAEFERLLQTKSTAGSNMTDTSKVVICLDLAADIFGADLDMKTAIKYSGLKPSVYTNSKKFVENLLDMTSEKLTISSLCLTLQCSVQELAGNILDEYKKQAKTELDLMLPQYVCMAVYHACRLSKVKIPKRKFIEKSHLKSAQWVKLEADWTKFVDDKFAPAKKKRGRPPKVKVNDENDNIDIEKEKKEVVEQPVESYDDWKRRMLDSAYKELRERERQEKMGERKQERQCLTPRRSPRKTPQKYSPYKSPLKSPPKGGGVRLLFPKDF